MGLVARRAMQMLLDECADFLTREQVGSLIEKLNGDDAGTRLGADYEVLLLNALSKMGLVKYELGREGSSRPDVLFRVDGDPPLELLADITTVSDRDAYAENPADDFIKALYRVLQKRGVRPVGIDVRFKGAHVGPIGRQKMKLILPPRGELHQLARRQEVLDFAEAIRSEPATPHETRLDVPEARLHISYSPQRPYNSSSMPSFTVPYALRQNPVAQRLHSKIKQIKKTGYKGITGVLLCDGHCEMVREPGRMSGAPSFSTLDVVQDFFRRNRSLSFVTLLTVREPYPRPSGPGEGRRFELKVYENEEAHARCPAELTALLGRIPSLLPPPEESPINALHHYESELRHAGRSLNTHCPRGWRVSPRTSEIRLPARVLCEVLAGQRSLERFLQDHRLAPSPLAPQASNFFADELARGLTLRSARIEMNPTRDDDMIVMGFSGPDPALSPFIPPDDEGDELSDENID